MANNLIGCWGSPAANQIICRSNPLFGQLHNTNQLKERYPFVVLTDDH